ncbi:MAG: putative CtpA-like serine protease [Alphaproteobacteria bacterium MarineAlpha3_Bin5]|nr:MAG: putative CtpA-like serine protease [Alphaproteobacteria bacterium MarineAlpha3_Bin5]
MQSNLTGLIYHFTKIGTLFVCLLVLSGCLSNRTPTEVLQEFLGKATFPPHVEAELARFEQVYYNVAPNADEEKLDYFRFAFKRIRSHYVRKIGERQLIDNAITGMKEFKEKSNAKFTIKMATESALRKMLASLDPHSGFMDAEEFRDSFSQTKGEFGGLGIQVTMQDSLIKVIAPIEDTPASRAGIQAGDFITHIDGIPVLGKTLSEAVRIMRGAPGTSILLRIRRDESSELDFRIVRAVIKVKAIRWKINGAVGYIRIIRFSEKTQRELRKALIRIKAELGPGLTGIVIDLRNNPGGLLDQSVQVADDFLDSGEIVSIRGRTPSNIRSYTAKKGDVVRGIPIVVLINNGSASASEIVASALQFHGRATIMGSTSFGKGSVQTIMPMPVEGALRLTTSLYYAPSGNTIQATGVTPDIVLLKANKRNQNESINPNIPREVDLPGAIKGLESLPIEGNITFFETQCPVIGEEKGEEKDFALMCALTYLKSGSIAQFRAALNENSGT